MIIVFTTDGTLNLSEAQTRVLNERLESHKGKEMQITIEPYRIPRTLQQNKYLWGIVYKYIADYTGHHVNEVHEALKKKFLLPDFVRMGEEEIQVAGSTKELSTQGFGEYVDRVVEFAGSELSLSIPSPE